MNRKRFTKRIILKGCCFMNKGFLDNDRAFYLIKKYGSPLYVYNEKMLRLRCRELRNLLSGINLRVNYSAKANSNIEFLRIINS